MSVSASAERREFRRLTLPLSARFRLRDSTVVRRGTIENISGAGAAILTPVPLPANGIVEQLRFSLSPEDSQDRVKVSVAASVVKSEPRRFADSSERYRSGLVFLDLEGEPLERVSEIIDSELSRAAAA
ncbi:MAG: PilZ domain-containing protein [bacterium]|nr:PilZ domain-containing protein [bacterium]